MAKGRRMERKALVARGTEAGLTPWCARCRCTGGCVSGGHGGRHEPRTEQRNKDQALCPHHDAELLPGEGTVIGWPAPATLSVKLGPCRWVWPSECRGQSLCLPGFCGRGLCRFWGCPCKGRMPPVGEGGNIVCSKGGLKVPGGTDEVLQDHSLPAFCPSQPAALQAVGTPGLGSPRPQDPQLACEPLPHWDLPKISLPSQTPLHLFSLFQILNTSQELKDTDLEYLEVRRYQVLGCHPIPALTMRLEDWTRGTQMPSSSGPGFHGLERGWWVSDTRLEGG